MYEFRIVHADRWGHILQSQITPPALYITLEEYNGRLDLPLGSPSGAHGRWLEVVDSFRDLDRLTVYWRNRDIGLAGPAGEMVALETFIFREPDYRQTGHLPTFTAVAYSKWHILDWRHPLYYSGLADFTRFDDVPMETIGRRLVRFNCTAAATPQRWGGNADVDLAPMGYAVVVAADLGRGPRRHFTAQPASTIRHNLERLAFQNEGQGAFTLEQVGDSHTFELGFRPTYQGQDNFERVIFALEKRNMAAPRRRVRRADRATKVVGAGQGEGALRVAAVGINDDYSPIDVFESFLDARNADAGQLQAQVAQKAVELAPFSELTFEVLQTPDTLAANIPITGKHTYWVGDSVQIRFFGTERRTVKSLAIGWSAADRWPKMTPQLGSRHRFDDDVEGLLVRQLAKLGGRLNDWQSQQP